jgi:hypothetical protein
MEGIPAFFSKLQPSGTPPSRADEVNLATGIIPGFAPEFEAQIKDKTIKCKIKTAELFFI